MTPDTARQRGVHAASPESDRARATAEDAADRAGDVSGIDDELDAALTTPGGKHSRPFSPGVREELPAPAARQPAVTVSDRLATAIMPALRPAGLDDAVEQRICGMIVDLRGDTGDDMGPELAGPSGHSCRTARPRPSLPNAVNKQ